MTFSWRHWADWTGSYKNVSPTGETLEMSGMGKAVVTPELKIVDIEVFYDPSAFMAKLMRLNRNGGNAKGACPFPG